MGNPCAKTKHMRHVSEPVNRSNLGLNSYNAEPKGSIRRFANSDCEGEFSDDEVSL
jgi:hypothetical protein